MRPILWFLITLPALPAAAGETCKYVDHEGRVTFANVPVKNARRVMCFDPVPAPKLAPRQVAPTAKPETAAPGGVAKVDSETQRRRDTDRKRILEQELGDEQRLLDQALRAIQDRGGSGSKEGVSVKWRNACDPPWTPWQGTNATSKRSAASCPGHASFACSDDPFVMRRCPHSVADRGPLIANSGT